MHKEFTSQTGMIGQVEVGDLLAYRFIDGLVVGKVHDVVRKSSTLSETTSKYINEHKLGLPVGGEVLMIGEFFDTDLDAKIYHFYAHDGLVVTVFLRD